jgi:hypothetical protein
MSARPKPPPDFDENPPLDDDFFARAVPASHEAGIVRRASKDRDDLRAALEAIVRADAEGRPLGGPIAQARELLGER